MDTSILKKLKKYFIIFLVLYVLYQITIGTLVRKYHNFFEKEDRREFVLKAKNKILKEMKNANNKDKIFSEEEKKIIRNFLRKILTELDL